MKKTQDLVPVIEKELSPLVKSALALEVKSASDMPPAVDLLSKLNIFNDRIKKEKDRILKPLKEAMDVEKSRWAPIEKDNKAGIEYLREQISDYQTTEIKRQREEEAKIAEQLASGKIKKPETAMKKMDAVDKPESKVSTDSGSLSFREDKVLVINDRSAIPDSYWIVDEDLLLEDLKAGKTVEGATLDIKLVPINRRN